MRYALRHDDVVDEERREADAEDRAGKSRHVLVAAERHRKERIDRPQRSRKDHGEQDPENDRERPVRRLRAHDVDLDAETAAGRAHTHDAGNAQIEMPRFLGQDLPDTAEQEDHAE